MSTQPSPGGCLKHIGVIALAAWLISPGASAASLALQVDTPWQTSGANTGSLGPASIAATSTRWYGSFGDQWTGYASTGLFGELALAPGSVGDFMTVTLATGLADTLTVTFNGRVLDPVFYLIDVNSPGSIVSVPAGGDLFTASGGAVWSGNSLLTPTGPGPNLPISMGAVRFDGLFAAGSIFTFTLDFRDTAVPISNDLVGIAISASTVTDVPVPEPGTFALLGLGLAGLGLGRRRAAS